MDTFKNYWDRLTPDQKKELASAADTSTNHLSQVANGHRSIGNSLMARLMQADTDLVPHVLRPDLYPVRHAAS